MDDISISRKRKLSGLSANKLSVDEAIDLFRERVEGWLLDPADTIEKEHGGFAIAAVSFPFIEIIGQVLTGRSTHVRLAKKPEKTPHGQLDYIEPNEAFTLGLRAICKHAGKPIQKRRAKALFKDLRCGVLHAASPSSGAYLEGHGNLIEVRVVRGEEAAVVDPHGLLKACRDYSAQLDVVVSLDKKARKRFARMFHVYVGEKFGLVVDVN